MNEQKSIACVIAAIIGSQLLWFFDALGAGADHYRYGVQDVVLALLLAAGVWVFFAVKERVCGKASAEKPVIRMYRPKRGGRADKIA